MYVCSYVCIFSASASVSASWRLFQLFESNYFSCFSTLPVTKGRNYPRSNSMLKFSTPFCCFSFCFILFFVVFSMHATNTRMWHAHNSISSSTDMWQQRTIALSYECVGKKNKQQKQIYFCATTKILQHTMPHLLLVGVMTLRRKISALNFLIFSSYLFFSFLF